MRILSVTLLTVLVLLAGGDARAILVREEGPQIKLSGFADLVYSSATPTPEDTFVRSNQAELGIETLLSPRVGFFMAPSWDGEAMSLATAYVQFENHSTDEYVFSRHLTGVGFVAGRFDVPFGIDWLSYPSIDRPLITPPSGVLGTHEGWNADGVMFLGCRKWFNLIVHATGGNDLVRETSAGDTEEWWGRHAEGGRLGVVPLEGLSLGGSAAIITAAHHRQRRLLGADAMLRSGRLDMRAEYIDHRADADGQRFEDHAWYVQGQWDFGPAYGIARWDVLEAASGTARSVSIGAGVPVDEGVILRGEYRADLGDDEQNVFYLQLAAGF